MFESLKPRSEQIDQTTFAEFLNESDFKELIEAVKEKMIYSCNNDEGIADSFETEPGYKAALEKAQKWLDRKGVRISTGALELAIVNEMDPDSSQGLANL